ncbi:MAG: CotH kinase family protein, partial [Candidatus Limivicinus sp.]
GNAKTVVTEGDKTRLISSLKKLSEQTDLEEILDIDEVLRYFVVHNFVVNGDSYTGSMIHNYYLHEKDGRLSMIPWDYNLAFGCFQANDASAAVNDPIDTPLSVGSGDSRPMADWIFANEEYTARYHELMAEFLDSFDLDAMITETAAMIAPYVEKDPTAFCSYEEFETGVETLRQFCALRSESVRGQLDGTIPSTDEGQNADSDALVDASGLTLSNMGSMGGGGGGFGGGPGGNAEGGFPGGPGGGFPGGTGSAPQGGFSGDAPEGFSGDAPEGSLPGSDSGSSSESASDSTASAPEGGFPGGEGGFPGGGPGGGFPGGSGDGTAAAAPLSQSDWIMIGACFAVLLIAILIAKKFRTAA